MNETIDLHLQLISFWSQPTLRWLLQLFTLNKHNFTGIKYKFGVVVAASHPHIYAES